MTYHLTLKAHVNAVQILKKLRAEAKVKKQHDSVLNLAKQQKPLPETLSKVEVLEAIGA